MAFLRVSESALRLGAVGGPGAGAGGVSVVLFEEKSRLMVESPERGCRSRCITMKGMSKTPQPWPIQVTILPVVTWTRYTINSQNSVEHRNHLRPCPSSLRPRGRARRSVLSET
jgi:hypothetical protein